jgi:hypothetical protein
MSASTTTRSVAIIAVIVVLISTFTAFGQSAKPGPVHQKMHVWLGDWTWEEEVRDTPTGAWYKTTWTGQVRLMQGGFFNQFRFKGNVKGREVTSLEIEGYDPIKKTNVTSFFDSDGTMGHVTSATYEGNKEEVEWYSVDAIGKRIQARCTWNFSSDSMSLSGSCEQLTDGKWWLFRKNVKAVKTKAAH